MTGLTHTTKTTKEKDIQRKWHIIDANNQILGRCATEISALLMGKGKATFSPNIDEGDFVVVINAKHIKVTGSKELDKIYTRYSGYPGGLKKTPYFRLHEKDPRKVIQNAVSGMLPKNTMRDRRMRRLYVFPENEHPYKENFNN